MAQTHPWILKTRHNWNCFEAVVHCIGIKDAVKRSKRLQNTVKILLSAAEIFKMCKRLSNQTWANYIENIINYNYKLLSPKM